MPRVPGGWRLEVNSCHFQIIQIDFPSVNSQI